MFYDDTLYIFYINNEKWEENSVNRGSAVSPVTDLAIPSTRMEKIFLLHVKQAFFFSVLVIKKHK